MNTKMVLNNLKEWIKDQSENSSFEIVQRWPLDQLDESINRENSALLEKGLEYLNVSQDYIKKHKIFLHVALGVFLKARKKHTLQVRYPSKEDLIKDFDNIAPALFLFSNNSISWHEIIKNIVPEIRLSFLPENVKSSYEELFDGKRYQRTLWFFS